MSQAESLRLSYGDTKNLILSFKNLKRLPALEKARVIFSKKAVRSKVEASIEESWIAVVRLKTMM